MDTVADVPRKVRRESILELDHGLEEELAGPHLIRVHLARILIVNVDQRGVVNLLGHHLGKEETQKTDKSFDVLFASEEDFLSRDGWLPQLA